MLQRRHYQSLERVEPGALLRRELQWVHADIDLHDDGERKISTDAINARRHGAGVGTGTAGRVRQDEAPDWAGQIAIEPIFLQRRLAGVHALLQPGIPNLQKGLRYGSLQKIAVAGQLAEETNRGSA